MKPLILSVALLLTAAAGQSAEAIAVPSGQPIAFHDIIQGERGPSGLTMRFRFIAPQIADPVAPVSFDVAEPDMMYLCENYALPRLAGIGPQVNQIIISLSDTPIAFGEMNPDVVQFFEAYAPTESGCQWEGF